MKCYLSDLFDLNVEAHNKRKVMATYTIGVDVGGTHTDVAIVCGSKIVGWSKTQTTEHIIDGVTNGTLQALENARKNDHQIDNVCRINIGTTHFINAVIKRTGLVKVACIRLCGVSTACLPPFSDFPKDLDDVVNGGWFLLNGGFEFHQEVISEMNEKEIVDTLEKILSNGVNHLAVTGVFSPTNSSQEEFVGELISRKFPHCSYTLSHQLGPLGLLERENASILNESLRPLCATTINGFKTAFEKIGLKCPVCFTQNDGTLISEEFAQKFPVYTFSSGATNSMRGASFLSSLNDAIIVDIGGTSTDVGVLVNGFPRESATRIKVGGVNTNFRMPDTFSIGLGGGSIVVMDEESITIGPASVEHRLTEEALVFGGHTLVATDIAVACGLAQLGDRQLVEQLDLDICKRASDVIQKKVEEAVDSVKLNNENSTVVLVGGGRVLVDTSKSMKGVENIVVPQFYQIANAVGAALSQVSGTFDKLVQLKKDDREAVLVQAKEKAIDNAVRNGAIKSTCKVVDVSEIQMGYVALPCVRLKVKVIGDLEIRNDCPKNIIVENVGKRQTTNEELVEGGSSGVSKTEEPLMKEAACLESTVPKISSSGDWVISSWDIDCLAIGCGILGCGGGGSPYLGWLRLKNRVKAGKTPRVKNPLNMKENEALLCVAYMGAPEILVERVANGCELPSALRFTKMLLNIGFTPDLSLNEVLALAKKQNITLKQSEDGKSYTFKMDDEFLDKEVELENVIVGLAEIGGLNALEPLLVAAELNIPVLDCDGMGRAFPQLQQFCPFIKGLSPYPASAVDHHGNNLCCVYTESAVDLENLFRQYCIDCGCSAGVCIGALSKDHVMSKMCMNTISQAWKIGEVVLKSRLLHSSPVQKIVDCCNGKLLTSGKICDLKRETKAGFTSGRFLVEGGNFNENVLVRFQNEFLIANSYPQNVVLATCPDLICLVNSDTGEPITSDELRYGLRVSILLLPAMPLLNSSDSLKFTGPKAFGFDFEYHKFCDFIPVDSIPKLT